MEKIKIFAYATLLIFFYLVSYYFFHGIKNPIPEPGDSYDYHIPISKSIIDGSFINLALNPAYPQWHYPGSSEAINSVFIFLNIPLTISNLLAILILCFVCFKLAIRFDLDKYYSLLFAATICTLTAITRWSNSVSIDIWFAIFFLSAIILLEKPRKYLSYFVSLGFILGMFVGSKYTALFYTPLLFIIYFKKIGSLINIQRVLTFILVFSLFGLFWYVRNFVLLGNPVYPLCIPMLPCFPIFDNFVWNISLSHPVEMINAIFSEYKLWSLSIIFVPFLFFSKSRFKINNRKAVGRILFLAIAGLVILAFQPTSVNPWTMVSSFRYSYISFILLILIIFLYAAKYKKDEWLGYFVIANALPTLSLFYYPKLLLFYFPTFIIFVYFFEKYNLKTKKV